MKENTVDIEATSSAAAGNCRIETSPTGTGRFVTSTPRRGTT